MRTPNPAAARAAFVGGVFLLMPYVVVPSLVTPAHAADVEHGRAIGAACASCHGATGAGLPAAGIPRLAGLDAGYLRGQLAAFAGGTRANASMAAVARPLLPNAMADVAAYYASLPAPATPSPAVHPPSSPSSAAQISAGRELAMRGDWSANIPPCASCHGRDGLGVDAAFPAIAGQSAVYVSAQLAAWKSGARHDDPQALMRTVAARLDDAQIAAVAAYYATLPDTPGSMAGGGR